MTSPNLPLTLSWLRAQSADPVPQDWVSGADELERQRLRALSSVATHVLGGEAPADWPADIREWMGDSTALPPDVAAELDVRVKEGPDEALATLYAGLVAGLRRRVLGTFFTPGEEVAPMLELWAASQDTPTQVIDVGAGVGVFTASAVQRWTAARVTAVDINPVTLGLLGARMAQPGVKEAAERVELVQADYTSWLPEQQPVAGARRLILGNPPYTRSQLIEPTTRAGLVDATKELCGSRASLSAFITALSLMHLASDDGLCLLLPAQWLESQYAAKLRRYLLDSTDRRIELHLVPEVLFDDAVVDAVVLLVGTQRETTQEFVVAEWKRDGRKIDRKAAGTDGWRTWFKAADTGQETQTRVAHRLDEVAVVRRGVATGANSFFLLSEEMLAATQLPTDVLQRVVHRLIMFGTVVNDVGFAALPSTERAWLFSASQAQVSFDAVDEYLKAGMVDDVHERYLCRDRQPWHDLSRDVVVPDVIVTAMSKNDFRIVSNEVGAAITNNLYGLKWRDVVPARRRVDVLEWLRSPEGQGAMRAACRRQGNGLNKLEPKALAALELPANLFA